MLRITRAFAYVIAGLAIGEIAGGTFWLVVGAIFGAVLAIADSDEGPSGMSPEDAIRSAIEGHGRKQPDDPGV